VSVPARNSFWRVHAKAQARLAVVCRFQDIEEEFSWRFRDIDSFPSVVFSEIQPAGRFIGHIDKKTH
jgi:hypothetical protein